MKLLEGSNFQRFDMFTIIVLTVLGILQGQVTVFYIIYLFWFQELTRTIIDNIFISKWKREGVIDEKILMARFGGFFLLFIYLVFIIVLFGIMLNWGNNDLIYQNVRVFLFRNWFFNLNIFVFAVEYWFYRKQQRTDNLHVGIFNRNHIILHLSIIAGGFIQMGLLKKLNIESPYGMLAVIAPFLIIKGVLDYYQYRKGQVAA